MTLEKVKEEYAGLEHALSQAPNRDQAASHQRQIITNVLIALRDGELYTEEAAKIAKFILNKKSELSQREVI